MLKRLVFLRKIRNRYMKKAHLSFDGVNARLTCGDTTVPVAAQGHWPDTDCVDGRFLLRPTTAVAKGFPSKNLAVHGFANASYIDSVTQPPHNECVSFG